MKTLGWMLTLAVLVPGLPMQQQPYIDMPVMTPHEEMAWLDQHVKEIEDARQARAEEAAAAEQARAEEERQEEQAAAQAMEERSSAPAPTPERSHWDQLADCESGNWVNRGASFETGSARWHVGGTDHRAEPRPSWGNGLFYGGVQFTMESWAWAAQVGGHVVDPNPANNTREQQIAVAETLLDLQGWGAWPTCSKKLGLR